MLKLKNKCQEQTTYLVNFYSMAEFTLVSCTNIGQQRVGGIVDTCCHLSIVQESIGAQYEYRQITPTCVTYLVRLTIMKGGIGTPVTK